MPHHSQEHVQKVDPCFRRAQVLCHSQVSRDATESVIKQMKGQGMTLLCLCLPRAELSAPPQVFSASILHQSHSKELPEGPVMVVMEQNQRVFCCLNGGRAEPSDKFIFCFLQPVPPKKGQPLLPEPPPPALLFADLGIPPSTCSKDEWPQLERSGTGQGVTFLCSGLRGLGLTLARTGGQTLGAGLLLARAQRERSPWQEGLLCPGPTAASCCCRSRGLTLENRGAGKCCCAVGISSSR